jgi:S-formylglutathione hydrolase FrmB
MDTMLKHKLWRIALISLSFAVLGAQNPPAHHPLTFRIYLAREAADHSISGRMIVLLSPRPPRGTFFSPVEEPDIWIAAQEVRNLEPGSSVEVSGDRLAFPAPLVTAPPGDYYAMALLDVDHNAAYRLTSPGDVYSKIVPVKGFDPAKTPQLELTLSERVAAPPPAKLPQNAERIDFVSPALSAFQGRPIHMRGVMVLPPDYAKTTIRYPTVYWTHGFGGDERGIETRVAQQFSSLLNDHKIPPMIYVLLDESGPTGTHEFADSVNNGPWGTALTKELIPHLEKRYRMMARPQGRFVTGHSSGGWAALWLGVTYPDVFGGTWPTSPDPSDFRNFTGPDLRTKPVENMYRKPDGSARMLVRIGGKDVESFEQFARQERVLGDYGGQCASFEWVFSPRGEDGRPQQLFDRDTGAIDPAVADAWEKYDIAEVIRSHAKTLGPRLQDHIHLTVGTADTFHLDEPARLLDQTLQELGIRAQFTYSEGRTHFDLYEGGLTIKIANEMEAVAHPEPAKPAVTRKPGNAGRVL